MARDMAAVPRTAGPATLEGPLAPVALGAGAKRPAPEDAVHDASQERPAKRAGLGADLPDEISGQEIQQMLDQADEVHIENLNEGSLKRMVMQFERKIKRNQEMRIKHSNEPEKFLKSEVDLDEEVKRFNLLATHPDLFKDFVQLGALPLLVGLLNHANTDIAVDVLEVLNELTDPDIISEVESPEDFLKALFDAQLCQMSVDVLLRINEDGSEEDATAVSNCLSMMENLADISPAEASAQFAQVPRLLPWLIKRVRAPGAVDYNRVYASEILGILLQSSQASREAMVRHEGVDKLLRGIAVYRKKDPADSEESEYVQNMFDCLCSLMLLPAHQVTFGRVQGLELMIRMMKEHNFATAPALRLADHALRHCEDNCQIFVDKLGLKVLFAMFMKKGVKLKGKAATKDLEEHVTSIVQSLCRYCKGTPVARVLNKFTENHFEKLERLLEMHEEYARAVKEADSARSNAQMAQLDSQLAVDDEEQLFLDRCDAGLFTLQQVDIVLVRLANMGNWQVANEIGHLMEAKGVPLKDVCNTVEEYCEHLDTSAREERVELRGFMQALAKRLGDNSLIAELDSKKDEDGVDEGSQATPSCGDGASEPSEDEEGNATPDNVSHEKDREVDQSSHEVEASQKVDTKRDKGKEEALEKKDRYDDKKYEDKKPLDTKTDRDKKESRREPDVRRHDKKEKRGEKHDHDDSSDHDDRRTKHAKDRKEKRDRKATREESEDSERDRRPKNDRHRSPSERRSSGAAAKKDKVRKDRRDDSRPEKKDKKR